MPKGAQGSSSLTDFKTRTFKFFKEQKHDLRKLSVWLGRSRSSLKATLGKNEHNLEVMDEAMAAKSGTWGGGGGEEVHVCAKFYCLSSTLPLSSEGPLLVSYSRFLLSCKSNIFRKVLQKLKTVCILYKLKHK